MTITKGEMSYFQALKILDKVKEGIHYPLCVINQALELTGDLNG